jgi:hypothetical protein
VRFLRLDGISATAAPLQALAGSSLWGSERHRAQDLTDGHGDRRGRTGKGLSLLCLAVIALLLVEPAVGVRFGFLLLVVAALWTVVLGRGIVGWFPSRVPDRLPEDSHPSVPAPGPWET